MFRVPAASVVFVILMSLGAGAASAPSMPQKSPGEIAAASRLMVEKNADCLRQAKEQKLSFLKRRRFVRACEKN
jgi:uncharacterized membrane protein